MEMKTAMLFGILDWIFVIIVAVAVIICMIVYYSGSDREKRNLKDHIIRNTHDEHMKQIMIDEREDEKDRIK